MKIKTYINSLFPSAPSSSATQKAKDEGQRRLVAKRARGNVSLQKGRYTTSTQIKAKKAELSEYKF